jgi:hypothetical protein
MTKAEKRKFINDLIDGGKAAILAKLDAMPDHWDGIELRRLIGDYFDAQANWPQTGRTPYVARRRAYKNDCAVLNLP